MLLLPMLDGINALFFRLEKKLNVLLKIGTYEFKDGKIIKNNGLWRRATDISTDELQEWQIISEMSFDIVILKIKSGQRIVWIDRYNDLVGVLRSSFRERECQSS